MAVIVGMVALLVTACGGCAAKGALQGLPVVDGGTRRAGASADQAAPRTFKPAQVIYTAGGKLGAGKISAIAVQPGTGQRYLLLVEWAQQDKEGISGQYRLVRLDLSTGRARKVGAVDEGEGEPRDIACARSGRIAVSQTRLTDRHYEYRINVREPNGQWRAVTDWSGDLQEPDAWSPDSRSLLCNQLRDEPHPLTYTLAVMTETAGQSAFAETRLADPSVVNAVWAVDGSRLLAVALSSPTPRLVSIDWPSQKEATLLNDWPSAVPVVAEESGTLVVCVASGDDKEAVWRLQPGAEPELTPVTLPSPSREIAVSPDGKRLAVVLGKVTGEGTNARVSREGGLVIYGLDDAVEYRVPDTAGKNVMMLHWVLGGRALVFTIVPKGAWDSDAKAVGKQLWLARLP